MPEPGHGMDPAASPLCSFTLAYCSDMVTDIEDRWWAKKHRFNIASGGKVVISFSAPVKSDKELWVRNLTQDS